MTFARSDFTRPFEKNLVGQEAAGIVPRVPSLVSGKNGGLMRGGPGRLTKQTAGVPVHLLLPRTGTGPGTLAEFVHLVL